MINLVWPYVYLMELKQGGMYKLEYQCFTEELHAQYCEVTNVNKCFGMAH